MGSYHLGKKIFGNLFIIGCLASVQEAPNFLFYVAGFFMYGIFQMWYCPQTNIFYWDEGGNEAVALVKRYVIGIASLILATICVFASVLFM